MQTQFKAGDRLTCHGARNYPGLTRGKVYELINDLEGGIFPDRPYVTVIGDHGKEISCHVSRFEP